MAWRGVLAAVWWTTVLAGELPEAMTDRLGIRVTQQRLVEEYGTERPRVEGHRLLILDLQLVNRVTADLVFTEGIPESLAFSLTAFELQWNGQKISAGEPHLVGQAQHLPDPLRLGFSGAKTSGQLVFEVPAGPPSTAVLVFRDADIGDLQLWLTGTPDERPESDPQTSDTFVPLPRRPSKPPVSRHKRLSADTQHHLKMLTGREVPVHPTLPHEGVRTLRPGDAISEKPDGDTRRLRYALEVSEAQSASLWELAVVQTADALSMNLYDPRGDLFLRKGGRSQLVATDLAFETGVYELELVIPKNQTPFHLGIRSVGTLQPGIEFEPNDLSEARHLPEFIRSPEGHWEAAGRLVGQEVDHFILDVPKGTFLATVTLSSTQPAELQHVVNGKAMTSDRGTSAFIDYLHLLPGRHVFAVKGNESDYTLQAVLTPVPDPYFEEEPNATFAQSKPMQFGTKYRGILSKRKDLDWFRFHLPGPRNIRIQAQAPQGSVLRLSLQRQGLKSLDRQLSEGGTLDEVVTLTRGTYGIALQSRTRHEAPYALSITPMPLAPTFRESKVFELKWEAPLQARAYHAHAQQISGSVRAVGPLAVQTSHDRVKVELGEAVDGRIPVRIRILPHTPSDEAVEVILMDEQAQVKSSSRLEIRTTASPTQETWAHLPLPVELYGRLNVAAQEFGAKPVLPAQMEEREAKRLHRQVTALMDGFNGRGASFLTSARNPVSPVIELPGPTSWTLVGTLLKLDAARELGEGLREFSIEVSEDGSTFHEVFSGSLDAITSEQAFVFDRPVVARYIRLIPESVQSGDARGSLILAEWKVLAENAPVKHPDLGLASLGGHVVWQNAERTTRVIGFHHNRCARLKALIWRNGPEHLPDRSKVNPETVRISVATDSPFGPWLDMGTFDLDSDRTETLLKLPQASWARFVKLEIPPVPEGRRYARRYPLHGAIEAGDQPSILGEWGAFKRASAYERDHPPPHLHTPETDVASSGGRNREEARKILPGDPVRGTVWIDEGQESWFRVTAPEQGTNHLACRLSGERWVKAGLEAYDAAARLIRTTSVEHGDRVHTHYIPVRPGQEVWLRVFEPQRSFLFLWDDSGSMKAYVPRIHAALTSFIQELDPFTERVQLLPFTQSPDGGFLLESWGVNPHEMLGKLRGYGLRSSSSAHENLVAALKRTESLPGNRAILIMTDAKATEYPKVLAEQWERLQEQRVPIFGFHTLGDAHHVDVVQDWAEAGGGGYYPVESLEQLEVAFQRAKAVLRSPAVFSLTVEGAVLAEPAPGTLRVVSAPVEDLKWIAIGEQDAVEIILDASGSMRKRMRNGCRRIDVARELLQDMVKHHLPEGTPFALRAFGHLETDSCRTDLEIPLGGLNRKVAEASIASIHARNLGKTPLAASLAAVPGDLREVKGRKLIILLTDGKETCGGDPQQEIARMVAEGLDVRVNIIGFAIQDWKIKRQFQEWAALGGGEFFDATDPKGLADSLRQSLKPGFTVWDMLTREPVAEGRMDGDPVLLPPGPYRVEIHGEGEEREVEVMSGKEVRLQAGD